MSDWQPQKILIATAMGVFPKEGWAYKNLGLHIQIQGSPKGRRKPVWHLTHLGTGHVLIALQTTREKMIVVSTQIEDAGDWSFTGLQGFRNQFPDAKERIAEVLLRHKLTRFIGSTTELGNSEEMAMKIAGMSFQ